MKKRVSILLIITILIINISAVNVYATGYQPNDGGYWDSTWGSFENGVLKGYDIILRKLGFIVDTGISAARTNVQFVKDRLKALGLIGSDATDEDVEQFFDDNITPTSNSVTFSQNMNVYLKSEAQEIQNTTGYKYVYSIDLSHAQTAISNGDQYNAMRQFILEHQVSYNCLWYSNGFTLIPKNTVSYVYNSTVNNGNYSCIFYSNENKTQMGWINYDYYGWNGAGFNEPIKHTSAAVASTQVNEDKNAIFVSMPTNYCFELSAGESTVHQMFMSVEAFNSYIHGLQPYYISDKWNTYTNNSGNYTLDNSNSNNITYGDISTYTNNYYNENNRYPTPNEVNVYIDNNIPSGGGGSGEGEGEGGDSGSGSIFDWLSKIGILIGNLISGVGGFVAGVLEGVVNALTSILDTITSIITTITTSIPDNFNTLMTTILGWMPEEWTAVISAFLLVSLLVGLFKLFRG